MVKRSNPKPELHTNKTTGERKYQPDGDVYQSCDNNVMDHAYGYPRGSLSAARAFRRISAHPWANNAGSGASFLF